MVMPNGHESSKSCNLTIRRVMQGGIAQRGGSGLWPAGLELHFCPCKASARTLRNVGPSPPANCGRVRICLVRTRLVSACPVVAGLFKVGLVYSGLV